MSDSAPQSPCGSGAYPDWAGEIDPKTRSPVSWRCVSCMAVLGSVGIPRECLETMKEKNR